MMAIGRGKQILLFRLNDREFGLDVSCVREILLPQEIYPVPTAPAFLEGVINVRGHMIAVIDLKRKLRLKDVQTSSHRRIIVCHVRKFIVGILVDGVREVVIVSQGGIMPAPGILDVHMDHNLVWGIIRDEQNVVLLLDMEKVLTSEEAREFSQMKDARRP